MGRWGRGRQLDWRPPYVLRSPFRNECVHYALRTFAFNLFGKKDMAKCTISAFHTVFYISLDSLICIPAVPQCMCSIGVRGGGGDEDGEWDDESSGDCSGSETGMCGFSGHDCEELLCQGVKPWDPDAGAVLAALGDY